MPASADPNAIGKRVEDLETPFLYVDLEALTANIQKMAELCQSHGVAWRPHSKAHKSPEIAKREAAAGATGQTCAKLSEAEILAKGGIQDLLIANQIVGAGKMERLARLCQIAKPIFCVDHLAQLEPANAACLKWGVRPRVLIEVDIGLARSGVLPGEPVLSLAKAVMRLPHLQLAGIMGYEGHLLTIANPQEKETAIRKALGILQETANAFKHAGLPCEIVSAGGSGSFPITVTCPGITEVQAGGVVFMDAFYRGACHIEGFENALYLQTTIVSRSAADRAIVDAGRKSHNAEVYPPVVVGHPHMKCVRLSAEHGQFELPETDQDLKIGDRLTIIPGYSDLTTVLHDHFYVTQKGRVVDVWPLESRGHLV